MRLTVTNPSRYTNVHERHYAIPGQLSAKPLLNVSAVLHPNPVMNGKEEWTITITSDNEIIVMHKDESLA